MIEDYSIEPWEHENKNIMSLCETCHRIYHFLTNSQYDMEAILLVAKFIEKWKENDIKDFMTSKRNPDNNE